MTAAGVRGSDLGLRITPVVLTFNEAPNLARCLGRLTWAQRVVVLDSGSTDDTLAIARRWPNVDVHTRAFDDHTSQWNHAIDLVRTPWALSLDADYVLSDGFPAALAAIDDDEFDAAFASFRYYVGGRPLRASLYPPRAVLFRPDRCRYQADGHTQRLNIPGRSINLSASIDHDDRKPFARWFKSQRHYARLEARMIRATPAGQLSSQDRLRRWAVLGPPGAFVQSFILKGTALDFPHGWYYTFQRTIAESLVSIELVRQRLSGS